MRTPLRILLGLLVATMLLGATPRLYAAASAPAWEVLRVNNDDTDTPGDDIPPFEIEVRDGYIYVLASQQMKVEVFTILGQLVTSRKIQPGVVRLKLDNRGIYIIKEIGRAHV